MKKETIILCIIALVGIAYFDDIKKFFTGDRDKASQIMQDYIKKQNGDDPAPNPVPMPAPVPVPDPYISEPTPEPTPVTTTRPRSCNACVGLGKCLHCSGTGWVSGYTLNDKIKCASCNGTGICGYCGGTGQR